MRPKKPVPIRRVVDNTHPSYTKRPKLNAHIPFSPRVSGAEPPSYPTETKYFTLVLIHGGKCIGSPSDYSGKRVHIDYFSRGWLRMMMLSALCDKVGVGSADSRRFFYAASDKFVLLQKDGDLYVLTKHLRTRAAIEIYVESDHEIEVAVDVDEVVIDSQVAVDFVDELHTEVDVHIASDEVQPVVQNHNDSQVQPVGPNQNEPQVQPPVHIASDLDFEMFQDVPIQELSDECSDDCDNVDCSGNISSEADGHSGSENEEERIENDGLSDIDSDPDYVGDEEDFDEFRDSSDDETFEESTFNQEVVFNPNFKLGMIFENKKVLKKAITSDAINSKRCIKFTKNDKDRLYARCKDEACDWKIHALKGIDKCEFQIRKYEPRHKCGPTFHVSNMKSGWLGERCLSDFQSDPKRDIKGWRADMIKQLNVNISRQQAYRAKIKALSIIEGVPDAQYAKLWDYAAEIRRSNPGSTCVLDIDENGRFSKLYMCLGGVKRGFKAGCRPFIGIDGCFLKGPRMGILLTAVGVDPADCIYPIAYAVVPAENKETWEWFLICLKNDLGIANDDRVTFMSDKQKGLIIAMKDVLPNAEHRFCVRHMHNNFQKVGFSGIAYKNALWRAARASTVGVFNQRMTEMKHLNEAAAKWLEDKDPSQWSRAYFTTTNKCDMLLNNVCESFNNAILDAREKPIITMLEWIRHWLMERFQRNRDKAVSSGNGKLPHKIQEALKVVMEKTKDCIPIKSSNRHYEIHCSDGSCYAVDLELWSCSCRVWDMSGLPCKHAMSAMNHAKLEPENYVSSCYTMETYRKVYAPEILPMSGEVDWGTTMFKPPMPPVYGRRVGRPKKLRRVDPLEKSAIKMKKQHKGRKCGKCGVVGHYSRSCKAHGIGSEVPTKSPSTCPEVHATKTYEVHVGSSSKGPGKSTIQGPEQELPNRARKAATRGRKRGKGASSTKPGNRLVDEDDSAFEAILSQANDAGMIQGAASQESFMTAGPTPWEQLKMSLE